MKKEYICYYFDKCFKGKIDDELFIRAKKHLFSLILEPNLDYSNIALIEFADIYKNIVFDIEKDIMSAQCVINSAYFRHSNFLKKIKHKRILNRRIAQHANHEKFKATFLKTFGISLSEVQESVDAIQTHN